MNKQELQNEINKTKEHLANMERCWQNVSMRGGSLKPVKIIIM